METITIRKAELKDIPFLVETIIEAEKSCTDILSYHTVFGLSLDDTKRLISNMFDEEIDGCELSVSAFMVAESNGVVVGASSAWIEGAEGISSSEIKGNLLSFVLPIEAIKCAAKVNGLLKDLYIETIPGSIQKGVDYVLPAFRNRGILRQLIEKNIERLRGELPNVAEVYTQVFSCNENALMANAKIGFEIVHFVESSNDEIFKYLPSNKKLLLRKSL